MRTFWIALAASSALVAPALADVPIRTITVYGEAVQEIVPNEAGVQVTIHAKNANLQTAKSEHDKELKTLFAIADDMDIEREDIKTQYASVQPVYHYGPNNERTFEGYEVNTTVEVTVGKIDTVGTLVQELVEKQFDQIGNVQYRIDDDLKYRDEVLVKALANAKAKAQKLAQSSGGELGEVISITQGYAQPELPQPMMQARVMAMEAKADFGGGVNPPAGVMQVSGTVTVMYELK